MFERFSSASEAMGRQQPLSTSLLGEGRGEEQLGGPNAGAALAAGGCSMAPALGDRAGISLRGTES